MPRRKKNEKQKIQSAQERRYYENPAKLWMWVGVLSIMTIIIVFWAWAMKNQISLFSWQETPDGKLLKSAQEDLKQIINQEEKKLKVEDKKEQIKILIDKLKTELNSSTQSGVTTSAAMSSSTTENTTNTKK
ncbi:MAG: hypothetical protein AAB348_03855 [Patescibacteria group bacterium]